MFCDGGSTGVSLRDIVNLAAFMNLDKALDLKFWKISRDNLLFNGVRHDVYRFGTLVVKRYWDSPMYGAAFSPGRWDDTYLGRWGNDIVSLKLHLTKLQSLLAERLSLPQRGQPNIQWIELLQEAAAQFRPEALEQSVVHDLAERFGIDTAKPNIEQSAAFHGWSQAPWVSKSSPQLDWHAEEDGTSAWPGCRPDHVPFIGTPRKKFEIRDAMGRVQQIIGSWPTTWGAPFFLSFTLWYKEQDQPHQKWMFGRSAIKTCPYGLSLALENKDAIIVIDDDISMLDYINKRLIERHRSASPLVFLAWPRGLNGTTPAAIDWTSLAGRKILCVVENDRDSFTYALELNEMLLNVGAGSIEFVLPKGNEEHIEVDYNHGEMRGDQKKIDELMVIAEHRFGISPKSGAVIGKPSVWKPGDPIDSSNNNFLMDPIFKAGTISLLYSDPGVGKSWLALLIVYALATGGSLFGRFRARKQFRCLYLAGAGESH